MSYGAYQYGQQYPPTSSQSLQNGSVQSLLEIGAREINKNEYHVDVYTSIGEHLTLKIRIPDRFPRLPPVVTVNKPVAHPWVDSRTLLVTGARELYPPQWNQHLKLGRIVENIRKELASSPANSSTNMTGLSTPVAANYGYGNPSAQPSRSPTQSVPRHFPEFDNMTIEQLRELIDDEGKFISFFMKLPQVLESEKIEEKIREDNLLLAQQNKSLEPELTQLKNKLVEKHAQVREKKALYDDYLQRQHELAQKFQPAALEQQLENAYADAKKKADEIAEKFQNGEATNIRDFCDEYREASKLAHIRKIKLSKFRQLHS